jgi:hypothetical protein
VKTCIRVYNNGERVEAQCDEQEAKKWLEFNKVYRFGCALFIDGVCQHRGYLCAERVASFEKEFQHGSSLDQR